jgi:hypothetical protein
MAPLGYIEILDSKGKVTERFRVDGLPVTVGRAYTNQIILDDPLVSPEHLIIDKDEAGRLIARDLDSVNGLYDGTRGHRVTSLLLASETQFRIGHRALRYSAIDQPVAATVLDRAAVSSQFALSCAGLAGGILVFSFLVLDVFLGSSERMTVAKTISDPLATLSYILVWAGLWALVSRVVLSRFNFAQHFILACAAILGSFAVNASAEWVEFLFPSTQALWFAAIAGSGLLLLVLVYGHLGFASAMGRRSRLSAALLVSAATIGLSLVTYYASRSEFSSAMDYSGVIKPLDAGFVPAISVEQFMRRSDKLKAELAVLTQKARSGQP